MKVLVNKEEKELNLFSGCTEDCTRDFIGNTSFNLEYDNELEYYIMSEDDFEWWDNFFASYNKTLKLWEEVKGQIVDPDFNKIMLDFHSLHETDYENYPTKDTLILLLGEHGYKTTYYEDNSILIEKYECTGVE